MQPEIRANIEPAVNNEHNIAFNNFELWKIWAELPISTRLQRLYSQYTQNSASEFKSTT